MSVKVFESGGSVQKYQLKLVQNGRRADVVLVDPNTGIETGLVVLSIADAGVHLWSAITSAYAPDRTAKIPFSTDVNGAPSILYSIPAA